MALQWRISEKSIEMKKVAKPVELNNNLVRDVETPEFWEIQPPTGYSKLYKKPQRLVREVSHFFERSINEFDYDADSEDETFLEKSSLSMSLDHFETIMGCLNRTRPRSLYHATRLVPLPTSRGDLEQVFLHWQQRWKPHSCSFSKAYRCFRPPRPKKPTYGTRSEKIMETGENLRLLNRAMLLKSQIFRCRLKLQKIADHYKKAELSCTTSLIKLQERYRIQMNDMLDNEDKSTWIEASFRFVNYCPSPQRASLDHLRDPASNSDDDSE